MAYDKALAERIRLLWAAQPGLTEKKMFGGIGYMLHGNMAGGIIDDKLIVRVGLDRYEESLALPHTDMFGTHGRSMRGWITVSPEGYASDKDLEAWLDRGRSFALTLPPKS